MPTSDFGSVYFLDFAIVVYLIATVLYILYAVFRNEGIGKVATWVLGIGLLGQTVALVLKTLELGHAPFMTVYEALVFWSWLIALIYLLFQFRFRIRLLGAIVAPLAFLAIASASLLSKQASPLVPALRSGWLSLYIVTCFIGYACFAISFALGIAYLIKRADNPEAQLSKDRLDRIGCKSISIGFPFLTLGIITGAFWANVAWGSYWSWDPKETWSLITWFIYVIYLLLRILGIIAGAFWANAAWGSYWARNPKETWSLITWFIYAIYLLLRIMAEWKGKSSAIVSIIGFAAVLFTFFGVNFLLSGLH